MRRVNVSVTDLKFLESRNPGNLGNYFQCVTKSNCQDKITLKMTMVRRGSLLSSTPVAQIMSFVSFCFYFPILTYVCVFLEKNGFVVAFLSLMLLILTASFFLLSISVFHSHCLFPLSCPLILPLCISQLCSPLLTFLFIPQFVFAFVYRTFSPSKCISRM